MGQGWELVWIDKGDDGGHDGNGTGARRMMAGQKIWKGYYCPKKVAPPEENRATVARGAG